MKGAPSPDGMKPHKFTLTDEEMAQVAAKDLGRSEIVNHDDPAFVKLLCGMNIH